MRVKVGLSEQYRRAEEERRRQQFVADGTPIAALEYSVTLEAPVADLTPESREALLLARYGGELVVPTAGQSTTPFQADAIPSTPAEWDAMLAAYAAAHAAGEAAHDLWCLERDRIRAQHQAEDVRRHENNKRSRQREEAAKAQREQERADWIEAHGSDHLRAAVAAGYDCQRQYASERAALEHPGYEVDFNDQARWKSRSCPSEDALAEELRVRAHEEATAEVVWLTRAPQSVPVDGWEEDWQEREAVVISGWLGKYDLIRTEFAPADDPSDCAELPGGYQRLGRTLRHSDAVMLLEGHTDQRELVAQHTLMSGPLPEGCPETGPIPADMQQEMSETGTEGVWFSRTFPSVAAAEEFAAGRPALSARRSRQGG